MRRLLIPIAATAALVAVAVTAPAQPTLAFGPATLATVGFGEPSVAIGPDDAIYVATLSVGDAIAKSIDGGTSFVPLPLVNGVFGGNDEHIVVAPDNSVYLGGQWTLNSRCQSVSRGIQGGLAWVTQPFACADPAAQRGTDRPWLAVSTKPDGGYTVFNAFTDPCCPGANRHILMASEDQGLTWSQRATITADGYFPGYLVADDARNTLWYATTRGLSAVMVCRSTDRGFTWGCRDVASLRRGDGGLNHVFVVVDADGWVYTAWAEDQVGLGQGQQILFSSSPDGITWSTPQNVSANTGTNIYPTLDAMGSGRVAIGWYATTTRSGPNVMPSSARWFPTVAITDDAHSASPVWTSVRATETSHHAGILCTKGAVCTTDRDLLDFFMLRFDRHGRVNVAWADDNDPRLTRIFFARSL